MSYTPPNPNGQATMANSSPVVIASDQSDIPVTVSGVATATNQTAQSTLFGAVTETAPASDTASSGLNGRLQRIAQRLTSLIAQIPAALGRTASASSMSVTLSNEDFQDLSVTGQSAQTATVNNILTVASGSAATDLTGYRSASVQVVSTASGGTFIFEGSNDNTNFQTIPVFSQLILTGTPITAAITATATQLIYVFPVNFRYVRLRIATTITGGSIQAFSKFSQQNFTPAILQIAQATAANLNVNVGTLTTLSNGQTAHSSASTGSPVRVAGRVVPTTIATVDATLVAGDASDAGITTGQQLITKTSSTAELDYAFNFSTVASTVTVQQFVPASGTASVRNYITQLAISTDALGTGGVAWILDGALTVSSIAITTGLCTTSASHDLKIGDAVVFTALAGGTGVSTNTVYYVTSVGSATTFNFALTIGGSNVVPSVAYTGTTMYRILYQQHFRATGIPQTIIITFPNPLRGIANMITNFLIPTTMTSGTIYITSTGYRGF